MHDSFTHKNHLCLVFECLSSNLYELIKQNQFKGLSTQLVKVFTLQLLECLAVLKDARLIHCDLKPENILLKSYVTFKGVSLNNHADRPDCNHLRSRSSTSVQPVTKCKQCIHTSSHGSIDRPKSCLACRTRPRSTCGLWAVSLWSSSSVSPCSRERVNTIRSRESPIC